MKCPRCGNELKDGMLFCEHCGEEIRIVQDFEPEMEMNMETFSTETFSVEEDFPMDEILSDRMESARPKDAGGSMKAPGTEPFLKGKIRRIKKRFLSLSVQRRIVTVIILLLLVFGAGGSAVAGGQAFQRRLSV